jgi:glycerophosphoryl diester phosphodiesterase
MRLALVLIATLSMLSSCSTASAPDPPAPERRCSAGENLQLCGKNLVIAHRGGADVWPEETILAFDNAAKLGVDVLELDVHATADGRVICMHDENVERTTDGVGLVREKTFAELQALDAGAKFTTDGGKTFPYRGTGLKVPTLEEVLRKFPSMHFTVEIKQFKPSIVDAVIAVIEATGMSEKVVVASFDDDTVRDVRAKRPSFATSLAAGEIIRFMQLLSEEDVAAYKPPARLVQPPFAAITQERMRIANQLGMRIHVWTVDDRADMERMWKLGVHGIMTDVPELLMTVTREAGRDADKGR